MLTKVAAWVAAITLVALGAGKINSNDF